MTTVRAEFDGKVFVPCEPVNLPVGAKVEVTLLWPPGKSNMSPEQLQRWEEIEKQLAESEPYFPTVEDAIRYTRKYP